MKFNCCSPLRGVGRLPFGAVCHTFLILFSQILQNFERSLSCMAKAVSVELEVSQLRGQA